MSNYAIPNRPLPTTTKDINQIEQNFDALCPLLDDCANTRQLIGECNFDVPASTGGGPYFVLANGNFVIPGGIFNAAAAVMWFLDAANYAQAGKSLSLVLRAQLAGNAADKTDNKGITIQLSRISFGGTAGSMTVAQGTQVLGIGPNPNFNWDETTLPTFDTSSVPPDFYAILFSYNPTVGFNANDRATCNVQLFVVRS